MNKFFGPVQLEARTSGEGPIVWEASVSTRREPKGNLSMGGVWEGLGVDATLARWLSDAGNDVALNVTMGATTTLTVTTSSLGRSLVVSRLKDVTVQVLTWLEMAMDLDEWQPSAGVALTGRFFKPLKLHEVSDEGIDRIWYERPAPTSDSTAVMALFRRMGCALSVSYRGGDLSTEFAREAMKVAASIRSEMMAAKNSEHYLGCKVLAHKLGALMTQYKSHQVSMALVGQESLGSMLVAASCETIGEWCPYSIEALDEVTLTTPYLSATTLFDESGFQPTMVESGVATGLLRLLRGPEEMASDDEKNELRADEFF